MSLSKFVFDTTGSLTHAKLMNGLEVFPSQTYPIQLHCNDNSKIYSYKANFNEMIVSQAFASGSVQMLESVFEEPGIIVESIDSKIGPDGPYSQTLTTQVNLNDGSFVSFVEHNRTKKENPEKFEFVKAVFVGTLSNKKLLELKQLLP